MDGMTFFFALMSLVGEKLVLITDVLFSFTPVKLVLCSGFGVGFFALVYRLVRGH